MKTFDFNHADYYAHSAAVQFFLRYTYQSGMSEIAFIEIYQHLPHPLGSKANRKHRTPSYLRDKYRRLQKVYGFFNKQ